MDDAQHDMHSERHRLLAMAYRMTGTVADAEDVVHDAYARWYRLTDAERSEIRNPAAWLTTVASRIALDLLTSARHRREQYVGQWLPEPVPLELFVAGSRVAPASDLDDPLDRVARADAVATALLVVMEAMTPAERVAFVLHDVFDVPFADIAEVLGRSPAAARQLAASARRHVQQDRVVDVPRAEHDRVVRAFHEASGSGSIHDLLRVLAPDVELHSDGGGVVNAARNVVTGADNVARFLLGIAAKRPEMEVEIVETGDGLAFLFREHDAIVSVVNLGVVAGAVARVWIVLNPEKLTTWR